MGGGRSKEEVLCSYCGIEFLYEYKNMKCPNCTGTGEVDNLESCSLCCGTGMIDPNGDIFLCPECREENISNLEEIKSDREDDWWDDES
jgi:predicted RNA-binding Zn-ribbon protein involved in translation (DUF1610 family)